MAERMVQEWLTEYKSIGQSDIPAFSKKIKNNVNLIKSIFDVLQESHSNVHLQEPVCGQLYEFYRSGNFELKRFCLQFVPALIWNYLYGLAVHRNYGRAESLLLGIYNMEVVDPDGTPRVESFTVPTLSKPSIYHEPVSQLALTENVLSYQQSDHSLVTRGPLCQVSALTVKNRFDVLTHVMSEYNADIGFLSPVSHAFFCQICSRLVLCGFSGKHFPGKSTSTDEVPKRKLNLEIHKTPRIPLDSSFLLEMLTGVYFVLFNGQGTAGMQTVDDIHFRASYELYAGVLLVTNAIKHSLDTNPSGRPSDGPVGINVAITPPSPVVKRSAITNASFKARRQKETTITVTIEGVEKTEAVAKRINSNGREFHTTSTNAVSVPSARQQTHVPAGRLKHSTGVDVAVVDQSGSRIVETLEMADVSIRVDGKGTSTQQEEMNKQTVVSPSIFPTSHSKELQSSSSQRSSKSSSRGSFETNL